MFRNSYQKGFLSILYACGSRPLAIWYQSVKNGHIRRITDEDVQTLALEIMGANVATTFIICPADRTTTLGIRLPFFVMIVKNMNKYFTFEIQIRDDKNMSRRFRVSNYQSTTRVRPFSTSLPIGLHGGWNQIQFNLADFTRRAYGSTYLETLRVQIHANIRIRRIYFSDRLYADDELPQEFKLYIPISVQKKAKAKAEKASKVYEEKGTGSDKKESVIEKSEFLETVPSGALPTPTETPHRVEFSEKVEVKAEEPAPVSEPITGDVSEAPTKSLIPVEEASVADEAVPSEAAPSEVAPSEVGASKMGEVESEVPGEGKKGGKPVEIAESEAPPAEEPAPDEAAAGVPE